MSYFLINVWKFFNLQHAAYQDFLVRTGRQERTEHQDVPELQVPLVSPEDLLGKYFSFRFHIETYF